MRATGGLSPAALLVVLSVLVVSCVPAAPQPGATGAPAPAGQAPTSAPAADAPQRGGTLIVAFNADPETLDPHITTALLATRVLALIHDSLINRDYDGSF